MNDSIKIAIVGGGASGLVLATALDSEKVVLFERGDRVGKKLSATGNGQGNISNLQTKNGGYFSFTQAGVELANQLAKRFGVDDLRAYFRSLGVLLTVDERGRLYPAGKQASALTDALRFAVAKKGVQTRTGEKIEKIEKAKGGFRLISDKGEYFAEKVILATGGKASKNFGTDGNGYALAQGLGHSVTALYPALVQVKTVTSDIKTLKGIRVSPAKVTAEYTDDNKTVKKSLTGDLLFTDYGVSGDLIFRLSAFFSDKIEKGVRLFIDFLPEFSLDELTEVVEEKRRRYPETPFGELLCGIVNNQVGRAVTKKAKTENLQDAVALLKNFPLTVTGTLGFDYAQVTKGGIKIEEVDENLQSKKANGLYFTGEILDIDGECGGFNLQWAYSSAMAVATALNGKTRGQV